MRALITYAYSPVEERTTTVMFSEEGDTKTLPSKSGKTVTVTFHEILETPSEDKPGSALYSIAYEGGKTISGTCVIATGNRGGVQPNSGRPSTSRTVNLCVKVSPKAYENLCNATDNKSELIDNLLLKLKTK